MGLKANKKMIQNKTMKQSGKVITLKDLSNTRTTAGKKNNNCIDCFYYSVFFRKSLFKG